MENKNIFLFGFLFVIVVSVFVVMFLKTQDKFTGIETELNTSTTKLPGTLESMISPIVKNTSIENGYCLEYALYYEEKLKQEYPELDIRRIEMAGICPIGTRECGEWEGIKHTYLIVNGHGGECILDQHKLACIQVVDRLKKPKSL